MAGAAILSTTPRRSTRSRTALRANRVAISWTSSPTPNARRTGAPTTISPSRSSSRWRRSRIRCDVDRGQRWHGRYRCHAGPLCRLPAAPDAHPVRRSGELRVLRLLSRLSGGPARSGADAWDWLAHRRHWPPPRGAVLHPELHRRDAQGARPALVCRHALPRAAFRAPRGRIDRHQLRRRAVPRAAHARGRAGRLDRHAAVRQRRAVCDDLLRRRLVPGTAHPCGRRGCPDQPRRPRRAGAGPAGGGRAGGCGAGIPAGSIGK